MGYWPNSQANCISMTKNSKHLSLVIVSRLNIRIPSGLLTGGGHVLFDKSSSFIRFRGLRMVTVKVVNLVVTSDFEHKLDLEKIVATLSNVEYNPEQFPGLVMRIKEPKTSALLFTSGKIVCTGAKDITHAKKAVYKIIKSLKKVGVTITIEPQLKVQNLVGYGTLGFDLNLVELAMKLRNTEYEPEQFPGLVYKIKDPFRASFLLFSNGKLVCTGAKSEENMEKCLAQLLKDLEKAGKKVK